MNILVISQYYDPDPFRLHEVVQGLTQDGHKVTVLTGTPNYVIKKRGEKKHALKCKKIDNATVIRVPTIRRRGSIASLGASYLSFVITGSIEALLLDSMFDVIFVYQLSPIIMAIPAFIMRKRTKAKIALYCLDLWPESMVGFGVSHNSLLYKVVRVLSKQIYNSVDCLGYTSKLFEQYFKSDLGLHQKHYVYIPQFAEDIYADIENRDHDGLNYVFAGNIGEAQSVETIIKAAACTKNHNIKWHIVGDGRSEVKCQNLAKELNVTDKVYFYGRRPLEEMPDFYSIADAMVVTLSNNKIISYTLPGKVQSYMAAGIPIIAAASGETQMVIKDAKCGLCCESEDYEELAKVADRMAYEDRETMGRNAKEYYKMHFTKKEYIEKIEEMLDDIKMN